MKAKRPPLRLLSPIHKASRQVATYLDVRCRELAVSVPEGHLVTYLGSYSPAPVGDLGRVFGLKGSTLTSMLDRLEERGLLARSANPDDRRSFLVDLTAEGERAAATLRSEIDALEAEVIRRLPARDLAGFRAVLDTLGSVTAIEPSQGDET
jgi:DNA-binding MarR family transcriptional regulator